MRDDEAQRSMPCVNARTLVQSYLDGELSEEQASPLRTHLFACRACREVAKDEKSLKSWFRVALAEAGAPHAPAGFAATVARRAFAFDAGLDEPTHVLKPAARYGRGELLSFLLAASAAAAAVLLACALALERDSRPSGSGLAADSTQPPWIRENKLPGSALRRAEHSPEVQAPRAAARDAAGAGGER